MNDPNPIEEALNHIEVGIRQLKIQYDMFFAGAMPRQPFEVRKDLETLIKTVGDMRMQRFADRYRFNSLATKYQTMVELWNKMLRAKEEGRLRPGIPGFVEPIRRQQQAAAGNGNGSSPQGPESFTFRSPETEGDSLKLFYDRYVEASRKSVSYGKFLSQILAKTEAIKKKSGCESVTYSIEVKGKGVSLKARPARGGKEKK